MLVTEEEAKTKWCPHVRVRHSSQAVINRTPDPMPEADFGCIGSRCMSWRWLFDGFVLTRGYCGLAGPFFTPDGDVGLE